MKIASPTTSPKTTIPHAPNTPSDDPSTTNSKSSVRSLNWKGGRGGAAGWGSGSLMAFCSSPLTAGTAVAAAYL
jgi:hypothetical protein